MHDVVITVSSWVSSLQLLKNFEFLKDNKAKDNMMKMPPFPKCRETKIVKCFNFIKLLCVLKLRKF